MKLYLIRHGEAEDKDLNDDFSRKLTFKGIKNINSLGENLYKYILNQNPKLYTSNIDRAKETALIIKDKCKIGNLEELDFLSDGNYDKLLVFLNQSNKNGQDSLIFVGHEPYLSTWLYNLTGVMIEFFKSSICEIEIDSLLFSDIKQDITNSGLVKLNWYLKNKDIKRLKVGSKYEELRIKLKEDIIKSISDYHDEILTYREKYIFDSYEIESVHKLRVKIRQFRSLISFYRPLMTKKIYKEVQNVLRMYAQECAYLRELDVLIIEWKSLIKNNVFNLDDLKNITRCNFNIDPELQFDTSNLEKINCTGQNFLKIMEEEREKERLRLLSFVEKPSYAVELKKVLDDITSNINIDKTQYLSLDNLVNDTLDEWYQNIKNEYESINENELEIVHALRIKAKKIRYIIEVFKKDKDINYGKKYKEIKKWQEVIGMICDANRNSEAVKEIAKKYPNADIFGELLLFNTDQEEKSKILYNEFFQKINS